MQPSLLSPPIPGPGQAFEFPGRYHNDFISPGSATATGPVFSSTADAAEWLTTLLTSAVPKVEDNTNIKGLTPLGSAVGVAMIVNAGTNDHSVSMQVNGESFVITRKKAIVFEARYATSAIAGTTMFIGLSETDTTLLPAGGQTLGVQNAIGFTVRGTSGLILPIVKGAGTADSATGETLPTIFASVTAPALVNSQWCTLRFEVRPLTETTWQVDFYVDGIYVAKHLSATAALPLDASQTTPIGLTPSFTQLTQGSTANKGFIDYIVCVQER